MTGVVLAFLAGAPVVAQDAGTVEAPVTTGSSLPFTNNGANRPVLQTISPDGQAIAPDAMTPPIDAVKEDGEAAHEADHGAAHAEGKKGLPQFDVTTFPKQIFWLAVTFLFLYVVFSRITLPRIGAMVDGRASKVAADLEAAQRLKDEVEAVRNDYEAAIASAQGDAAKLVANVQADIKRAAEAQDAAFKAKAESATEAVEKSVNAARGRIMGELDSLAAELTVDIAARVAQVKVDAKVAEAAIEGLADHGMHPAKVRAA